MAVKLHLRCSLSMPDRKKKELTLRAEEFRKAWEEQKQQQKTPEIQLTSCTV